jgi:Cu(I)/Ag(I) efflux system membrane protein CusA/SilA
LIDRIVSWSSRHARLVILTALCLALAGEWRRRELSQDVIPELSDPKIALVGDWMGRSAVEVGSRVTDVLTGALRDLPGTTTVRGASMAGMAYVDVSFSDGSDLDQKRQAVLERLSSVRGQLPNDLRLQVGPAASSTGWVFQYALRDPSHVESTFTLRRFQEEVLRPALLQIPGVAEVATVGGDVQAVLVDVRRSELETRGLAFSDVVAPVEATLRRDAHAGLAELSQAPLLARANDSAQLRVADVARVRLTSDMPTGLADLGGDPAAVGGIVVARRDAALGPLLERVQQTLDRERSRLGSNVQLVTVYDRLDLVSQVGRALLRVLAEEIGVVVAVILLFLLHGRSALVPLMTLPVVLALTFLGMWALDVPATIMSLGGIGIALGLAVDADVVALEACHRQLEAAPRAAASEPAREPVVWAAGGFARAIFTSLSIAAVTFLPVLAFSGETGRLLQPLALTKSLVIGAALIVMLTLAPALRKVLLRGPVVAEFDHPLTRTLVRLYRPVVHFALARPALTLATAALALLSCLPIAARLGSEFLPRIDEGDLLFMPTTLPGISAEQAQSQLRVQDQIIGEFPEVASVFGKVGRADTATDPAPWSMAETTIRLAPRERWPKFPHPRWYSSWAPEPLRSWLAWFWPEQQARTTRELVERLDAATRLPGWVSAWTTPARARLDMLATGVRTPVGLRIVAADGARLAALGGALKPLIEQLPGTKGVLFESLGVEARLAYSPDADALARHEADPALVSSTAEALLRGGQVGDTEQAGRLLRVRVLPDNTTRGQADRLREASVRTATSAVPLGLLGRTSHVGTPSLIRSENGELVAYLYVDLRPDTDIGSYVRRGQLAIDQSIDHGELKLEPGERVEWTGQYALLEQGERRLRWIVPIVLASLLGLLFLQFRSWAHALIVLSAVPFALVGSVWTLYWLGYPLSAPVWVGLLSVVGLAMQTGVVMVVYIDDAFQRRVREGQLKTRADIVEAHTEGTVRRLRPKIMTVTTMAAGLLPLLWSTGAGAEIMRRVAAPMLGGLLTSAFLTLEVLPVLYTIWRYRQLLRAQRLGLPIASIVRAVPAR